MGQNKSKAPICKKQEIDKSEVQKVDSDLSNTGTEATPPPMYSDDYGKNNKIVTRERYEVLRKRMREKLAQLNKGV